jgi:hypothetical protein
LQLQYSSSSSSSSSPSAVGRRGAGTQFLAGGAAVACAAGSCNWRRGRRKRKRSPRASKSSKSRTSRRRRYRTPRLTALQARMGMPLPPAAKEIEILIYDITLCPRLSPLGGARAQLSPSYSPLFLILLFVSGVLLYIFIYLFISANNKKKEILVKEEMVSADAVRLVPRLMLLCSTTFLVPFLSSRRE